MRRYAVLYGFLLAAMLVLLVVVEAFGVPLLSDPEPLRGRSGWLAALMGVSLLLLDVFLPVPSSVVMIAHGALFGIALGTVCSMVGSLGAFAAAFAVGRHSAGTMARFVGDDERQRADALLRRWGLVAIVLSRPVPMLAETVAFAAGASSMRWRSALGMAGLASLPMAAVYAVAGEAASSFASGAVVFCAVVALAVGTTVVARRRLGRITDPMHCRAAPCSFRPRSGPPLGV